MHLAAEKGKHIRLRQFLSGNVDALGEYDCTALYLAASNGHLRCVTMLLDAKANVNALSSSRTALMAASHYGHLDVVNALIEARADPNIVANGLTALHSARNRPSVIAALLAAGALPDVPGTQLSTLCASICDSSPQIDDILESLKLLISAGADVDGTAYLKPPLSAFASYANIDCMKLLLDAKADVDVRHHPFDQRPLHIVLAAGDLEVVKLLIAAGADVTACDADQETYLHMLVANCRRDGAWTRDEEAWDGEYPHWVAKINETPCDYPGILRALVEAKADVSARGIEDMTPLCLAAFKNNVEAVNTLIAVGADPDELTAKGDSNVLIASDCGHLGPVLSLIAAGANVNFVNSKGNTALMAAISVNHAGIVAALVAAGADVNYVTYNEDHETPHFAPLDLAFHRGYDDIIDILTKAGAVLWHLLAMRDNALLNAGDIVSAEQIASANEVDKENALRYGIRTHNLSIIKPLLAAGVNPSLKFRGMSILSCMCINEATDIVRELIDAGADIAMKNDDGMTALQCAARCKHRDIVALLLAKANELKRKAKSAQEDK
jgi:ankyrin repeat protein